MFLSSNYADGLEVRIAELTTERNDLREQLAAIDDPLDYAALTAELATENTALRRQLAECQANAPKYLRAQNMQLRRAAQAFEAQLSATEDERDTLRRQLAHANTWRDSAIIDGNAARDEAAELRSQLAECRENNSELSKALDLVIAERDGAYDKIDSLICQIDDVAMY
jgi:chromosome segregation ATPase